MCWLRLWHWAKWRRRRRRKKSVCTISHRCRFSQSFNSITFLMERALWLFGAKTFYRNHFLAFPPLLCFCFCFLTLITDNSAKVFIDGSQEVFSSYKVKTGNVRASYCKTSRLISYTFMLSRIRRKRNSFCHKAKPRSFLFHFSTFTSPFLLCFVLDHGALFLLDDFQNCVRLVGTCDDINVIVAYRLDLVKLTTSSVIFPMLPSSCSNDFIGCQRLS